MNHELRPTTHSVAQLLKANQLRQTPIRQQVLALFLEYREALSQSFLEQKINDADRITLYRTLRTFEEKGLLHRAIDGTDKIKFALCGDHCSPQLHQDYHAHFHCDSCGRTLCLESVAAPVAPVLPNFQISSTHLVIRGECEQCGKKAG
jgi:Fur family ferric uptake transcriptional regulator